MKNDTKQQKTTNQVSLQGVQPAMGTNNTETVETTATVVPMTRAFQIREMIKDATEENPITVAEIARRLDTDYRSCFQVVRKLKGVTRRQITQKTKADNDLVVYGYYPTK